MYEVTFAKLSERFFKGSTWPPVEMVADLVDKDHVFCLLYKVRLWPCCHCWPDALLLPVTGCAVRQSSPCQSSSQHELRKIGHASTFCRGCTEAETARSLQQVAFTGGLASEPQEMPSLWAHR